MTCRSNSMFRCTGSAAVALAALCLAAPPAGLLLAQDGVVARRLGGREYRLKLLFQDDFCNLDNWVVETTGKAAARNHQLVWDCLANQGAGSIWRRRLFRGPTVVEYDAVAGGGANNLNFILYASNPPKGLLETTGQRTGAYSEYHVFPNYIVTYLSPEGEPSWRIRFRKNPGFRLLTERYVDRDAPKDRKQRLTYVLDDNGVMRFFVDGRLLHQYQDQDAPYREGRHGFRTWHSLVKYSNFKVYAIEGRRDANR